MSLSIGIDRFEETSVRVKLCGRLNTETATACEEEITPILGPQTMILVFDLSELTYISSAGLRVIFKAARALKAHSGKVRLKNLRPQIAKVFEIIKAVPDSSIFRDEDEVDDYLDTIQLREREKHGDREGPA